jgi:hypothetical protein
MTREPSATTPSETSPPGGIYARLERQAEAALGRNPGDVSARVALAELLCGRGDYRGAFAHFHQAAAQAPDDPRLLASLARACRDIGEEESFFNLVGRLRRIDPQHVLVRAAQPLPAGAHFQGHRIYELDH